MQGDAVPDNLLAHVAPLGWEHIALTGDYVWSGVRPETGFRPLRDVRSAFLPQAAERAVLNKSSDDPNNVGKRRAAVLFQLFDEVEAAVRPFLVLPDHGSGAATLWAAHTHLENPRYCGSSAM